MRRFVTLLVLSLFSIPFGISVTGCHKAAVVTYCNGGDSGPIVGQTQTITLAGGVYGLSLNEGQIGNAPSASAVDCRDNSTNVTSFVFSSSNTSILDIQPSTGRICAGTWNRNTGPVPDYTVCTANGNYGTAYIYANAGATSNPVPVYVHPIITSIIVGAPSTNCFTDPATNCSPAAVTAASTSTTTQTACTTYSNGCCTTPILSTVTPYTYSCVSQSGTAQLAARAYAGSGSAQTNISCQVGHLQFAAQAPTIVTIDENGVATAQQPGATLLSAGSGQASSSAGYFSTCPPATITLALPGTGSTSSTNVTLNQNNTEPLTAIVHDINGHLLTGLSLEYESTTPTTIPAGSAGTVTPTYPGAGAITAICQPPFCNPAPINEIGLNGNGTPITSNAVNVTTPGTDSTILYIGSTQSRYIVPIDFTTGTLGAPVQLPFIPNSMVITEDLSTLYFGSSTELMVYNTYSNSLTRIDTTVSGTVLSASPDNTSIIISDPIRKIIYLYGVSGSAGGVISTYGGVGTSAQWSPDSQTVYIAAGNQLITHSNFTGWNTSTLPAATQNIAVTVPSVGAYLSGTTTTGVSYCPSTTVGTTGAPPTTTNVYYPVADNSPATTDQLAATNDGLHILGATVTGQTLDDILVTLPVTSACPSTVVPGYFHSAVIAHHFSGITATSITGIYPASDSSVAFVTYTGTGGVLPAYAPNPTGTGTLTNVTLMTGAVPAATTIVPVAGVFSSDNSTFYAGTAGDDKVHIISKSQMKDTGVLSPNLADANGNPVVPNLLAQHPKLIP